jgi:hypothetical protein
MDRRIPETELTFLNAAYSEPIFSERRFRTNEVYVSSMPVRQCEFSPEETLCIHGASALFFWKRIGTETAYLPKMPKRIRDTGSRFLPMP